MTRPVKVLAGHTGDPDGYHMSYLSSETEYLSKAGDHRGSSYMWRVVVCNDPSCEFRAIVRWDALSAALDELIAGAS